MSTKHFQTLQKSPLQPNWLESHFDTSSQHATKHRTWRMAAGCPKGGEIVTWASLTSSATQLRFTLGRAGRIASALCRPPLLDGVFKIQSEYAWLPGQTSGNLTIIAKRRYYLQWSRKNEDGPDNIRGSRHHSLPIRDLHVQLLPAGTLPILRLSNLLYVLCNYTATAVYTQPLQDNFAVVTRMLKASVYGW